MRWVGLLVSVSVAVVNPLLLLSEDEFDPALPCVEYVNVQSNWKREPLVGEL